MQARSSGKIFALLLVIFTLLSGGTVLADDGIRVTLDGQAITFDQPPVIQNGRTLVPFRAVFEKIGMDVEYDNETKVIGAFGDDYLIGMQIDNPTFYVSPISREISEEDALTFDVPPQIINGRTLIPISPVLTAIGYNVSWDAESKTVIITSPGYTAPVSNVQVNTPAANWKSHYADITPSTFYTDGNLNIGKLVHFKGSVLDKDTETSESTILLILPNGDTQKVIVGFGTDIPASTLNVGDTADFYSIYIGKDDVESDFPYPIFLVTRIEKNGQIYTTGLAEDSESLTFDELHSGLVDSDDTDYYDYDYDYDYDSFFTDFTPTEIAYYGYMAAFDTVLYNATDAFFTYLEAGDIDAARAELDTMKGLCTDFKRTYPEAPSADLAAIHNKLLSTIDVYISMCDEFITGLDTQDIEAIDRGGAKLDTFLDRWMETTDELDVYFQ